MKKSIILLAIALVSLNACRIDKGNIVDVTAGELSSYAERMLYENYFNNAFYLSTYLLLDEYIKATPEQQKDSALFTRLKKRVHNVDDYTYHLDRIEKDINTRGKSFLDEGDPWGTGFSKVGENVWTSGSYTFTVIEGGEIYDIIVRIESEDIEKQEHSSAERAMKSISSLKGGHIDIVNPAFGYPYYGVVGEMICFRNGVTRENTFDGTVQVDIWCNDRKIDWVTIYGNGGDVTYKTSR